MHKITKSYWENTEINEEANYISEYENNNISKYVRCFHLSVQLCIVLMKESK